MEHSSGSDQEPITPAGVSPPKPLIVGSYRLDELLGLGSHATVHLATHLPSGRRVAVKVIDILHPPHRTRAYSEAEALRLLKWEKHIVGVEGLHESARHLYIFMEWMEGGDLATHLNRFGPLEEDKARGYFAQLLRAIRACHERGIAHHDVKLENILLSGDGKRLVLVDFGLSARMPPTGWISEFCGSPLYMSPELFSLQPHNSGVDVWGLGVCLFKMVTDRFPFLADSYGELEEKVLFDKVTFPSHPRISPSLKNLLKNMLTKDPKHRITLDEIANHKWWTENL